MTKLKDTHLRLDGCSRCSSCHTIYPLDRFYTDASRPSGVSSRCKVCEAERHVKRYAKRNLRAGLKQLLTAAGKQLAA